MANDSIHGGKISFTYLIRSHVVTSLWVFFQLSVLAECPSKAPYETKKVNPENKTKIDTGLKWANCTSKQTK